jgi:2-hydroxymuconate-semialdehyde hydrolase
MSPVPIGEPERLEIPTGGTMMSAAVWGAPGAPPVVLLHGMPTNALLWRRIGPTLSAEGFRAFAPDLLGYGKSGDPTSGRFGIVDQARYVHQFLVAIGLRDVVVVGHDIGGGVAQHLAISHPELVMGSILVNTTAERNWPAWPIHLLGTRPFNLASGVVDMLFGFERVMGWGLKSAMHHPIRLTPPAVAAYTAPFANRGGLSHLARLARDLTARDTIGLAPKLAALGTPSLVLWGREDPYLKIESGRQFASALHANLIAIDDCSHLVPEECPFALAEQMLPFLKERLPERIERIERTTGRLRRSGEHPKPEPPQP